MRKRWIFGLMPIMVSFFMVSGSAFAASHAVQSGTFKAYGIVTGANSKTGTITMTVNRASGSLEDKFFGRNVTFHASGALRINTCSTQPGMAKSCWNQLSENVPVQTREAERGAPNAVKLNRIKIGAPIYIMGHYNRSTGRFTVKQILEWRS